MYFIYFRNDGLLKHILKNIVDILVLCEPATEQVHTEVTHAHTHTQSNGLYSSSSSLVL